MVTFVKVKVEVAVVVAPSIVRVAISYPLAGVIVKVWSAPLVTVVEPTGLIDPFALEVATMV